MPDDFDYSQPRGSRIRQSTDQPIITMLLIALSVVFTAAFWYSNYDKTSPVLGISNLAVVPANAIWDGKYWALILCMFPHVNIFHIAFNMTWTWRLGAAIEKELNPVAYLLFIVLAAIIGAGVDLCISGQTGIGMSGVGYAMFGLMWAGRGSFDTWRSLATRDNLNLFLGWGVLCIITTYLKIMPVGNGAHAGGFVFGLCVGYLWYSPRKRPAFIAPLVLLCAAVVFSVSWLPWSNSWQWWRGNRDLQRGHALAAIEHYNLSIKLGGYEEGLLANIVISWTEVLTDAVDARDNARVALAQVELKKANEALAAYRGTHALDPTKATGSDSEQGSKGGP